MINRRFGLFGVIALLTLTELGFSGTAEAQLREGHFRIGVLVFSSFRGPLWSAFVEELRKLGYVEGQNTALEVRTAESQQERLPALASELVALNPEVIFTSTAPAVMALKEIGTFIPVVFAGLGDVVRLGVVESIRHPGANFTGITNNSDELQGKRLQLLKELVPDVVRVATFQNPLNASSVQMLGELEKVSNSLGTEIIPIEIKRGEDLPEAIDGALRVGAQALISTPDPITYVYRSTIIELSRQKHLPTMYPNPSEAKDGGLIAFGADGEAQWRRAAVYVDKILRGAKPADLPVEQATPILAINRKTAEALGIKIPPTLLGRADEVIE